MVQCTADITKLRRILCSVLQVLHRYEVYYMGMQFIIQCTANITHVCSVLYSVLQV